MIYDWNNETEECEREWKAKGRMEVVGNYILWTEFLAYAGKQYWYLLFIIVTLNILFLI